MEAMTHDEIYAYFEKNYEAIFQQLIEKGQPKTRLGPMKPVRCRFCSQGEPEVSFRKESHAIPQSIGNPNLLLNDECDSCNEYFGAHLENDLGRFTKAYRVTGGVAGKGGMPTYVGPGGASMKFDDTRTLKIYLGESGNILEEVPGKKVFKMNLLMESHVPCLVYRALVKGALSVMPESELGIFQHALRWVRRPGTLFPLLEPLRLAVTFVPGFQPYGGTSVTVLRKRTSSILTNAPCCIALFGFGNLLLQLIVPSDADAPEGSGAINFVMPVLPTPGGKTEIRDMTSCERTQPEMLTLNVAFESMGP